MVDVVPVYNSEYVMIMMSLLTQKKNISLCLLRELVGSVFSLLLVGLYSEYMLCISL